MKPLLLLLAGLLVGCATNYRTQTLTPLDNGREVTVKVGEFLTVELPSNHTTGYGWADHSEGIKIVQQIGSADYMQDSTVGLVGAGGTEIWQFRATTAGRQNLRMDYIRPWEKDVAPVKTVSFILVVSEK